MPKPFIPSTIDLITMSPVVRKSSPALVGPRGETPSGNLPLSPIDKIIVFRLMVDLVLVFTKGNQPGKVIREALSLALNHYYPLAGRLVEREGGDLEVACIAEGAWFVEAYADCSLDEVNFLEIPLVISERDILPYPRPGVDPDDALVRIQVTEFTCGGFALGCLLNHALFDGLGQAQFIKAIGDMARTLTHPTTPPTWSRSSLPGPPPQTLAAFPPFPKTSTLECTPLDITLHNINQIKTHFTATNGEGRSCTTFEALAAKLWQSWTRSVYHDLDRPVEFRFAVNLRPMLEKQGILNGGYYGNCVHAAVARAPSGKIADVSVTEVIGLIREAKERVEGEFWSWARGEVGSDSDTGCGAPALDFVVCVDWRRLGYGEVDFGWGGPSRWGPLVIGDFVPSCVIVNLPVPMVGARLLMRVVAKENQAVFLEQMRASLPV